MDCTLKAFLLFIFGWLVLITCSFASYLLWNFVSQFRETSAGISGNVESHSGSERFQFPARGAAIA